MAATAVFIGFMVYSQV
jgi:hypothetical protein